MYVLPLFDTLGKAPVCLLAMKLSASLTVMNTWRVFLFCGSWGWTYIAFSDAVSRSKMCSVLLVRLCFVSAVVEHTPLGLCCMCPTSVAHSTPMYGLMVSAVRPGHPWRYSALAAVDNVHFGWDLRAT